MYQRPSLSCGCRRGAVSCGPSRCVFCRCPLPQRAPLSHVTGAAIPAAGAWCMNPDRPPEELQARRTSGKEKVAHWGFTQAGGRFVSLRAAVIERVLETVGLTLCRRVVMAAEPLSLECFFNTLTQKMLMRGRACQDWILHHNPTHRHTWTTEHIDRLWVSEQHDCCSEPAPGGPDLCWTLTTCWGSGNQHSETLKELYYLQIRQAVNDKTKTMSWKMLKETLCRAFLQHGLFEC